jgi:hypothetical protein
MNHRAITLGISVVFVAALASACGDDETQAQTTGPGPGAGGSTSTNSGGMTGTGGDGAGASGGDTGSGGEGQGGQSACASYCSDNIAACAGNNAQWVGADPQGFCEASCDEYALGTEGDTSGDTLGCRVTNNESAVNDPAGSCSAAGPYGGSVCGTTQCQVFCSQIQAVCSGGNEQYANEAACLAACALLADATVPYSGDPAAIGNTFACRGYHLTAASVDPATHCPHAGGQAQPCM